MNNLVTTPPPGHEHTRTGMSVEALKRAFLDNLFYIIGRYPEDASEHDNYQALAYTVRDRMLKRWIKTQQTYMDTQARTVCYLSAEFLLGPHLANNLYNLGIFHEAKQAMEELGLDFQQLLDEEPEPGLGNGGLGRLAACYLDSLATGQIPAIGYGIRYEFGIFDQQIEQGWQKEITDHWLHFGNPWELPRPCLAFPVKFGGRVSRVEVDGRRNVQWEPDWVVQGVGYDTPILGYGVNNANLLRLWQSRACNSFNLDAFNLGDHIGAVNEKTMAENITKVLYPNDDSAAGKELRLKQQYFFVSCSLQDMIRLHLKNAPLERFPEKFTAQLNDTHPAIAVVELMRLLVDEHAMPWDQAWDITRRTFAYTNHTLLPEALEVWPVEMLGRILPRHLQLIYEINQHFLDDARMHDPYDHAKISRLSLIDESAPGKLVRMANLACAGSYSVNGVARLHSELLKDTVLKDFYDLWPGKFSNKTNGVSPRRFVLVSNPPLKELLCTRLGPTWMRDPAKLRELEQYADDAGLQEDWRRMKLQAKSALADCIKRRTGGCFDPRSLFDVQVKRIHEYKRQHLNLLYIITLYNRLKQNPGASFAPRTFVFGGKAAPGYFMAKLIIKLINSVAEVINHDPQVGDCLRVVFIPDFNVKTAQPIYPAADLSEQISTAGMEASGTGNMKFAMNGALTIGTLDGANVEIREEVGPENFFLFGLTAQQVMQTRAEGYRSRDVYERNAELRAAIDLIGSGLFSHGDSNLFRPLLNSLLNDDRYLLLADYEAYVEAQDAVDQAYRDPAHWTRMSILNAARMGKFSSDRAIQEYCDDIWKVGPTKVEL